jgi:uncharacterized phage infection (PIP) family protein YhgE
MLMIVILVGILVAAFGVSAWMWVQIQREAGLAEQRSVVPVADVRAMEPLPEVPDGIYHQRAMEEQKVVYEDRLREVREELKAAEAGAQERERGAAHDLSLLRDENEALKVKLAELQASSLSAGQDAAKVDHLIVENSAFRAQLVEASAEVSRLKGCVSRLEQENMKLKDAAQASDGLEVRIQQAKEEYQHQMDRAYAQVEELRAENIGLQQRVAGAEDVDGLKKVVDELSGKVREFEVTCAIQAEKNEYLQYELTKSRAQVVGLERVCETLSPLNAQG